MISLIQGTVKDKHKSTVTLLTTGGVGYEVFLAPITAVQYHVGQNVSLYTYLKVSDSALDLYGFITSEERQFFLLLLTVSGVGPKTAMNILTLGSIDQIQSAIGRGDVKYLTAVSGMGKKTAERLVVELKSKVGLPTSDYGLQSSDVMAEVIEALEGMGYSREAARQAVEKIDPSEKKIEKMLRQALQHLIR